MTTIVLILHAAATVMMAGLIWFVQVVHYPLMASVGRAVFTGYEGEHVRRTGWIVGPLMLVELGTALALVAGIADGVQPGPAWTGLILLAIIWGSTAFVQVPCHRRLGAGFDETTWRRLVASNWLRTASWTVRAGIALTMLMSAAVGGR